MGTEDLSDLVLDFEGPEKNSDDIARIDLSEGEEANWEDNGSMGSKGSMEHELIQSFD